MRAGYVPKWVYDFAETAAPPQALGRRGAQLADLARVLGPERIPAGFTVIADARSAAEAGLPELAAQVSFGLARLEERAGHTVDRLLVSAPVAGSPLEEAQTVVTVEQLQSTICALLDTGPVSVEEIVGEAPGRSSLTGSACTRDALTGAPQPSGSFTWSEGPPVARSLHELARTLPEGHRALLDSLAALERRYERIQAATFAIADGRLRVLSRQDARCPAQAMIRFACDAVDEGLLTEAKALMTIDADTLDALLHPTFDPTAEIDLFALGVAASPGAAKGELVFTAEAAVAAAEEGRDVILARRFADAGDVAGFSAARGVMSAEGGKTSHAAMVARGMGLPAVVGLSALKIDPERRTIRCGDTEIKEFDQIAIDGSTGAVTLHDVDIVDAHGGEHLARVLGWADAVRVLEVRVNADVPEDARHGIELGAQGIGVCRTEHMFLFGDRQEKMRAMIVAPGLAEREAALAELLPLQQHDFEGLFEAMRGLPVTIRLLDPPLHEFLPNPLDLAHQLYLARETQATATLEARFAVVTKMVESNPMLGTRGCRLGIMHPEIYEMQVEAIMRAARAIEERLGDPPHLEVMIPLVDYEMELEILRKLIVAVAARHQMREGIDFKVGTMIELPRACLVAGRLAEHAEFFSFGTNDLTQTALGFSRDDVEAEFFPTYLERQVFDRSPFQTIDTEGVGELIQTAVTRGRERRPDIGLGVCGEHGGDPESISFFHRIGVDYVSCSRYRLPVARVAAAQAQISYPRVRRRPV